MAKLRAVLLDAISEEDIRDIASSLAASAKAGDLVAVKLLLSYLISTPSPMPDPDRVATDEAVIEADLWAATDKTRQKKPGELELMFGGL